MESRVAIHLLCFVYVFDIPRLCDGDFVIAHASLDVPYSASLYSLSPKVVSLYSNILLSLAAFGLQAACILQAWFNISCLISIHTAMCIMADCISYAVRSEKKTQAHHELET